MPITRRLVRAIEIGPMSLSSTGQGLVALYNTLVYFQELVFFSQLRDISKCIKVNTQYERQLTGQGRASRELRTEPPASHWPECES